MAIFIKDILYLPMTGRGEFHHGSIRIEGQRITAMGDIVPKWGDEIIYGQDKCALPGFVNCHTHAAMTMLRGYGEGLPLEQWLQDVIRPAENSLTDEDFYLGNLLAHLEMLKSGTTCYADMYFDPGSAIWAAETSGIRGVLGAGLVDYDGRGEYYLREALRFAKEHENDLEGRIHFMLAPHALYSCSENYLQSIAHAAEETGLTIHIHVAETEIEQEACLRNHGKRALQYLDSTGLLRHKVLAAHMVHLDESEMELAGERGVSAIHCPQSNMKLASGIFPHGELKKHGVPIALGTDGAASNNDLDMVEEMRTAILLQKVAQKDADALNPYEALSMATINGAKALGLDDEIGTLEVGKKADINIISLWRPHFYPRTERHSLLSHLVYCMKSGDVHTVIVNGKIIVRERKCVNIDEGKLYQEVQHRAARM